MTLLWPLASAPRSTATVELEIVAAIEVRDRGFPPVARPAWAASLDVGVRRTRTSPRWRGARSRISPPLLLADGE